MLALAELLVLLAIILFFYKAKLRATCDADLIFCHIELHRRQLEPLHFNGRGQPYFHGGKGGKSSLSATMAPKAEKNADEKRKELMVTTFEQWSNILLNSVEEPSEDDMRAVIEVLTTNKVYTSKAR